MDSGKKKSVKIAVVASFFIPGLGQIYNGEIIKGLIFVLIGIVLALISFALMIPALMAPVILGFVLLFGVSDIVFWEYNIYDAYRTSKRMNAGLE